MSTENDDSQQDRPPLDYDARRKSEEQTRESEAKTRESEAHTRRSEAKTRESEAQTRLSEQETRESQAQARASEAQTRASEQETRASETQTRASEKDTLAAEKLTGELQRKTRSWQNTQSYMLIGILIITVVSIVVSSFALNRQSRTVQTQAACNQEVKAAVVAQQSIDAQINEVNAQDSENISRLVISIIPFLGRTDAQPEIRALFDQYHNDSLMTGQRRAALAQEQKDHPIPDIRCDE